MMYVYETKVGFCVYDSKRIQYLREDGTWHDVGAKIFATREEAEAALARAMGGVKIEAGKYYRRVDGEKVGPAFWRDGYFVLDGWHYNESGRCGLYGGLDDRRNELDIIAEWVDEAPKLWCDMTPEEKGALLLAHHEGKVIEKSLDGITWIAAKPRWANSYAYRVKPQPPGRASGGSSLIQQAKCSSRAKSQCRKTWATSTSARLSNANPI